MKCPPASLFNLIVYAPAAKQTPSFDKLLKTILDKFPAHLIYIHEKPAASFIVESENRILIKSDPSQASNIPFYILPHLIPDLPIYLLWGENPTEEKAVIPLMHSWAQRLIFDSVPTSDLTLWSKTLLEMIENTSLDIVDMNWALSAGWRGILTQIFDTPERLADLSANQSISISYNVSQESNCPEIQALFLIGWLASKLNWQIISSEEAEGIKNLNFDTSEGALQIEMLPGEHKEFSEGEIVNIDIVGRQGQTYSLVRRENSQVVVHNATHELCHLPFTLPLPNLGRARQFMTELLYRPISKNYQHVLQWISQYGSL